MSITAFENGAETIRAADLTGPVDLYRALLTVKNGYGNGVTKMGCYPITKANARKAGIKWSFVLQSVELLGLKITNRAGRHGHSISN